MRNSRRLARIALLFLLTCAVFPVSNVSAQEVDNHSRLIKDARLTACLSHFGQRIAQQNSAAKVPLTIKLEVARDTVSDQPREVVRDPVETACIAVLAQNLMQNGSARVPFVIRVTQLR